MRYADEDKICGAILLIFAIVLIYIIIPSQIKFRSEGLIQPQAYPRFLGTGIIILSAALIVQSFLKRTMESTTDSDLDKPRLNAITLLRILGIIGVSFLYTHLINVIGYVVSSIPTLGILMFLMGVKKFKHLILVSVLVPIGLFLFFAKGMYIVLPKGVLF